MDENSKERKKLKTSTIIYALIIIVFAFLVFIGVLIYGLGKKNKLTETAAKHLPYPAAVIDYKNIITLGELNENIQSVRKFYESQDFSKVGLRIDFSTDEGKKRLKIKEKEVINKMIEDKIIEILANKNGIKVTNDMLDQAVSRQLEQYGSAGIEGNLDRLYGWTIDDFKSKIVRGSLYKEELEKVFAEESSTSIEKSRSKIEEAEKELDSKKNFTDAAKKYSDGATAQEGGEMGWYKRNQIIPVLADSIFSLDAGKRSGIVESELGYHIAELEEKKKENDEELVRFRQIFVRKMNFADWLSEKMKDFKVWIPVKDYYWNKESLTAEFKNQDLIDFERKSLEDFQGDASIIF
jgi:parvulin-like peptidyl-prolyl isomerase